MSDASTPVAVVIVAYQSRDTIGAALDALRQSQQSGLPRVIVVDNASHDGTADHVAEQHPWVRLIRSPENLGYGRACNSGLKLAAAPYVLLMNADAVVGPDALGRLVAFMDAHQRAGICGPAVVEESGSLQPAGALPSPLRVMLKPVMPGWANRSIRQVVPGEAPARTHWICGSVMLVRRSMIDQVGGFDPRFFLYFEESDLCLRAQRAGWEIWTVGEAVCQHVNAGSVKKMRSPMMWGAIPEHYFPSRFYYLVKHHGWLPAVMAELGEVFLMAIRTAGERLRGRSYAHFRPRLRAPILRLPPRVQRTAAPQPLLRG